MVKMKKELIDIKPGDQTSKPIYDVNNNIIIGKNVILEAKHIEILKRFKIQYVEIADESLISPEMLSDEIWNQTKEYFNDKINWDLGNMYLKEIYDIAVYHKAIKYFKEAKHA